MSLVQRLEVRQGQALVMTPQLLQAIKLLQLSQLDLAAYVEAELERNPLLERAEPELPGPGETSESSGHSDDASSDGHRTATDRAGNAPAEKVDVALRER